MTRTIGEVKNVKQLGLTNQLRDYILYAQKHGYTFDLYVRKSTVLTDELQQAEKAGLVKIIRSAKSQ